MDLVHLVKLVVPWEDGEQAEHLEEDATDAPVVHLVVVVTVGEETFRRTIPSGGNIFCERRL